MGSTCSSCEKDEINGGELLTNRPGKIQLDNASVSDSESSSDYDNENDQDHNKSYVSKRENAKKKFKGSVMNGDDSSAIQSVQEYGSTDLLSTLFPGGDTALHIAVKNKSYSLIYYLITRGISPNIQNKSNGQTALHIAVQYKQIKIVSLLIQHGADVQIKNNKNETALSIASDNKDEDIIELLAPKTQKLIATHISSNSTMFRLEDAISSGLGFGMNEPATSPINEEEEEYSDGEYPIYGRPAVDENDENVETYNTSTYTPNSIFAPTLNKDEENKLKFGDIKKQNPFNNVTADNTKRVLNDLNSFSENQIELPVLNSWLKKKSSGKLNQNWKNRWVLVLDSHFLWAEKQKKLKNVKSEKERNKFGKYISLLSIKSIQHKNREKDKEQRIFILEDHNKKQYQWKCATEQERNFWINGLQKHVKYHKKLIKYLGTK